MLCHRGSSEFGHQNTLEAYRATFRNHGDVMVLDANSDFFKYFRSPGVGGAPAAKK